MHRRTVGRNQQGTTKGIGYASQLSGQVKQVNMCIGSQSAAANKERVNGKPTFFEGRRGTTAGPLTEPELTVGVGVPNSGDHPTSTSSNASGDDSGGDSRLKSNGLAFGFRSEKLSIAGERRAPRDSINPCAYSSFRDVAA